MCWRAEARQASANPDAGLRSARPVSACAAPDRATRPTGVAVASYTTSRTGWTIGGGVDDGANTFRNDGISTTSSEVLVALMYKFGAPEPAPVAAKY